MLKEYLKSIADAIRTKKGTTAQINAQDFPGEILSIESGSGGSAASTRPPDWLDMPDVSENEIYLLLHLSPPAENFVAFNITCQGTYLVEYGTVVNKSFVPAGSTALQSGEIYKGTFLYNEWSDEISDGTRQVMLRITSAAIYTFRPAEHENRNYSLYRSWDIVEFKGNLPLCTSCKVGQMREIYCLRHLTYFTLEGTNKITNHVNAFANCSSLIKTVIDTSNGIDFDSMYEGCGMLVDAGTIDVSNGNVLDSVFAECRRLRSSPLKNTGNVTNMYGLFFNCTSLTSVELNINSVTQTSYLVSGCDNLKSIKFTGSRTDWQSNLDLNNTSLTAKAIEDFFNSLPTITVSRAITLTGTPAAKTLTTAQIAIATGKGWTVTL